MIVPSYLFVPGASASRALEFANQEESVEIALIVFNIGFDNAPRVLARSLASGDSCSIFQLIGHHVLHAARSVIERHRLDFRMAPKKVATLVERHRMRQHAPQRYQS